MAPYSSTLAWKIPWMEETGGLQSMGSQRVRHNLATSLSLFTFMHWRRQWHATPVFLPGESQGRGSLVGCRLWGCTESDTTEATKQQQQSNFSELCFLFPHDCILDPQGLSSSLSALVLHNFFPLKCLLVLFKDILTYNPFI